MKLQDIEQVFLLHRELKNLINQRDWLRQNQQTEVRLKVEGHANAGPIYVTFLTQDVLHRIDKQISTVRIELDRLGVDGVGFGQ